MLVSRSTTVRGTGVKSETLEIFLPDLDCVGKGMNVSLASVSSLSPSSSSSLFLLKPLLRLLPTDAPALLPLGLPPPKPLPLPIFVPFPLPLPLPLPLGVGPSPGPVGVFKVVSSLTFGGLPPACLLPLPLRPPVFALLIWGTVAGVLISCVVTIWFSTDSRATSHPGLASTGVFCIVGEGTVTAGADKNGTGVNVIFGVIGRGGGADTTGVIGCGTWTRGAARGLMLFLGGYCGVRLRCGENRISFLGCSRLWRFELAGFSFGKEGLFQSDSSVEEPIGGGGAAIRMAEYMGRCSCLCLVVGWLGKQPYIAVLRKSP